jgi:hypothetical protein
MNIEEIVVLSPSDLGKGHATTIWICGLEKTCWYLEISDKRTI